MCKGSTSLDIILLSFILSCVAPTRLADDQLDGQPHLERNLVVSLKQAYYALCSLNADFIPMDMDRSQWRYMQPRPGLIVEAYDRHLVGNDTSRLPAGLDGADSRSVVDCHDRCQIGMFLQSREHSLAAGVHDGVGHKQDVRLKLGLVQCAAITGGTLTTAEPVSWTGEEHNLLVTVLDQVLDGPISASFVVAQYAVNGGFVEDVIYENDGQAHVAQLEDEAWADSRPIQDQTVYPALMYHVGYDESPHRFSVHVSGEHVVPVPGQFRIYALERGGGYVTKCEIGWEDKAMFVADVADGVRACGGEGASRHVGAVVHLACGCEDLSTNLWADAGLVVERARHRRDGYA